MAEPIFVFGGEVEPPYFIGRSEEITKINLGILNAAQSHMVIGPRRIGKTSLLKNLQNRIGESILFVYVNCRKITSLADFFWITARALILAYEEKSGFKGLTLKFSEIFNGKIAAATRSISEIGGTAEYIGHVYLRFREEEIDEEELVSETFEFIDNFAKETKEPVVIALDEFQELSKLKGNIFNLFKCHMDSQSSVRYIFSGSSLSLLNDVFLEPDSPLYMMAAKVQLDSVKKEDVGNYIRTRLEIEDIRISDEALGKIYEYTDGFPFYFQKLGFILYWTAVLENRNLINSKDVHIAFSSMLGEFDSEFEASYSSNFSRQQQNILKYLSKEKTLRLKEIARDMQTPASSLTTSMKDLYYTMTVQKSKEGTYGIQDNVFRLWIKKNILEDF